MNELAEIKSPIMFNCWKHHAQFILKRTQRFSSDDDLKDLEKTLLLIGTSQMDLYIGKYTPNEISQIIREKLQKKKLLSYNLYNKWLQLDRLGYKLISLPDRSKWTLRLGRDFNKYVHIHPARNSVNTIRVKATTLKTGICVLAFKNIYPSSVIDTPLVNNIRKELVNAPPLKSFKKNSGLDKLLKLFGGP